MYSGLSKAAGVLLAALAAVWTCLLVWGAQVAAAARAPLYEPRPLQDATPASTTDVLVSLGLVAAAVCAGIVVHLLISRHERRATSAQVERLAVRHEFDQKRKAA